MDLVRLTGDTRPPLESVVDGSRTRTPHSRRTWGSVLTMLAVLVLGELVVTPPSIAHAATTPTLLGEQQWYKLLPHTLSDSSDLAVNVASGDLVVHSRELHILGTGLSLSLDRYYNSEATSTGLFGTWSLGTASDVSLIPGSTVTYTGPTGFQAQFASNGAGGYKQAPGVNATLSPNPTTGACTGFAYVLTFNKSGERYCFDSTGKFQKDADRNGDAIVFGYTAGQLTNITDTQGRVVSVTYGTTGSIQRLTDSTGRYTAHTYTTSNQLYKYTDASGMQTIYSYNTSGLLSEIQDPLGNETTFTYSVDNRHIATITYVTNNTKGTGPTWQYTYNTNETTVTDPNLNQTQYNYDSSGHVTSVVDANGHSQASTYTTNDDAQILTDGLTQVSNLNYDTTNNLTSIQAPASAAGQSRATYSATYTAPGQTYLPSSTTDPQANCQSYTYDASGNLANVYAGQASPCSGLTGGAHYTNAYQGDGTTNCGAKAGELCTSTDPKGNVVTYGYDSNGNVTSIRPPSPLGSTLIAPDALSRAQMVTDGKSQLTTYTFDAIDRITQIMFNGTTTCATGSTCIKYVYDGDGNLTRRVDNTGTTNFYYDGLNRLTTESIPGGGAACAGSSPAGITFAYDGASNLTSYCDSGGMITYGHDPANNMTSLAEPTGSCMAPVSLCTTFGYNNNNERTSTVFPGDAEFDVTYDNAGNVKSTIGKNSAGTILTSFTYTYNRSTADTTLRQTMVEADPQATATTTYAYDRSNRVTSAATSPGTTLSYSYDADGNRCSVTTACTNTYTYNAANELTASPGVANYFFDGNGNETGNSVGASFTYNSKNQATALTDNGKTLSSVSYADVGQAQRTAAGSTSYASSPFGVQIATTGSSSTYYTRDSQGNLIGERTPDGSHWYYLKDASDSIVGVTGPTGLNIGTGDRYLYDPFGNMTLDTGAVNNVWGFAGGATDTTGLVKFGTRYYDPSTGRWTQQDPIGGSIANPATVDRYPYSANDPTNSADPTGTCDVQLLLEGIDLAAEALGAAGVGIAVAIVGAPSIVAIPLGIVIIVAGTGSLGFAAYEEFAASGCF